MFRPSRTRSFRLCVAVLAALAFTACEPTPDAAVPTIADTGGSTWTPGPTVGSWEAEMLAAINTERATAGVPALEWCNALTWAAGLHSADQAAHLTMSHTGSDGSTLVTRAEAARYVGWSNLGENVAAGYPSVSTVMGGWMGSEGHRANLLSPDFTHVGLGRAIASNGTPYWTQDFGRNGTC